MKFRDLTEARKKYDSPVRTVYMVFGRFNPVTKGHMKLFLKLRSMASSQDLIIIGTGSTTGKKDPLTVQEKNKYLSMAFKKYPKLSDAWKLSYKFIERGARTLFDFINEAATIMQTQGYNRFVLVVGSDRVPGFTKLLQQYEQEYFGSVKDFRGIQVVSAGERDPDSSGVSGYSASRARQAAVDGEYDLFKEIIADLPEDQLKKLFDLVRSRL